MFTQVFRRKIDCQQGLKLEFKEVFDSVFRVSRVMTYQYCFFSCPIHRFIIIQYLSHFYVQTIDIYLIQLQFDECKSF